MNNDELKIVKLLQDVGGKITPSKNSLEKLLQNIDNKPWDYFLSEKEDVTKRDYPRYSYSMNWKFAAPIFLVAILLVGFVVFKNSSKNTMQPVDQTAQTSQTETPQTVTAQNADTVLNQTDSQINQDMTQLDNDLTAVDATNNQEEDPNSL